MEGVIGYSVSVVLSRCLEKSLEFSLIWKDANACLYECVLSVCVMLWDIFQGVYAFV